MERQALAGALRKKMQAKDDKAATLDNVVVVSLYTIDDIHAGKRHVEDLRLVVGRRNANLPGKYPLNETDFSWLPKAANEYGDDG